MDRTTSIQRARQFLQANQLDNAEAICRHLLAADPQDADALIISGMIANRGRRWDSAAEYFCKALEARSVAVEASVGLGVARFGSGDLSGSESALADALRLDSRNVDANQNMAILQREMGHLEAAAGHFRRALETAPGRPMVRVYLATTLRELGRFEESDRELGVALRALPGLPEAHMQMAWNHLLQGRFAEGWAEYEWRWRCAGAALPRFPLPIWNGSDPAGRRIMLHAEQGYGDTIQFIRYAKLLAGGGATVVLYCQEAIGELMSTAPGLEQVISDATKLPPFDAWCPLLSLPKRFGTTLETIPDEIPYLRVDERRAVEWRERIKGDPAALRVGLCWTGSRTNPNHVRRSIPPDELSALGGVQGVLFYKLQIDSGGNAAPIPLVDHTRAVRDFADTAALIAQMDLVISVDTAAAHLAGALGKKVWTLLPSVPEWRWLLGRSDSPWYPTMRLMRKGTPSWRELVEKVAKELNRLIRRD